MKNFEVPALEVIVKSTILDTRPDKSNAMNDSKNGDTQFHIASLLPGVNLITRLSISFIVQCG